jgi:hypothetical protein
MFISTVRRSMKPFFWSAAIGHVEFGGPAPEPGPQNRNQADAEQDERDDDEPDAADPGGDRVAENDDGERENPQRKSRPIDDPMNGRRIEKPFARLKNFVDITPHGPVPRPALSPRS